MSEASGKNSGKTNVMNKMEEAKKKKRELYHTKHRSKYQFEIAKI